MYLTNTKAAGKSSCPGIPGQTSVFKHVVYIIKENRTYDQVFGDMPQGNGDTSSGAIWQGGHTKSSYSG